MGLKKYMKKALLYASVGFLSGSSLFLNYVSYKNIERDSATKGILISDWNDDKLMKTIVDSEGKNLEERIKNVIKEDVDFLKNEGSKKFNDSLFSYLNGKVSYMEGDSLKLKEKISYAQLFSSSFEYNPPGNFIRYISEEEGIGVISKSIKSAVENIKLNLMSPEKMIKYENGLLCRQQAIVFCTALNSINNNSANPEKIYTGLITFVPNNEEDYGFKLNAILSLSNAVVFSESTSSIPHSVSFITTEKEFYIIDPQIKQENHNYFYDLVSFYRVSLDINNQYADSLR